MNVYALVITETKELLDANSFKAYWKNYGNNSLYGWRKPKKIYTKLGLAKTGFSHIPDALKPHVSIAEFSFDKFVLDGKELQEDQKIRKDVKVLNAKEKRAKRDLKIATEKVKLAQLELERLKK